MITESGKGRRGNGSSGVGNCTTVVSGGAVGGGGGRIAVAATTNVCLLLGRS